MRLIIEVTNNDGPGQPLLMSLLRDNVHPGGRRDEITELLEINDAPDMKSALWLAVRSLESSLESLIAEEQE